MSLVPVASGLPIDAERCPACGSEDTEVRAVPCSNADHAHYVRRCAACGHRWPLQHLRSGSAEWKAPSQGGRFDSGPAGPDRGAA